MSERESTNRFPATQKELVKFSRTAEDFANSQFGSMIVFREDNLKSDPIPFVDEDGNEELLVFQRVRTMVVNGNRTETVKEYKLSQLDRVGNEIPRVTYINAFIHEQKANMGSLYGPIESVSNSDGLPATSEEVELATEKIQKIHKRNAYNFSK